MAVDPSIALGVKPLQVADPLAQYAQIAQLQGFQNQNQVAQMQLEKARQADRYLANMREAIINNGGPADMEMAAKFMATHPDPNVQLHGIQMMQAQQELEAFNKRYNPSVTGGFGKTSVPSGALGSGTYGITPPPIQAPAQAQAPVNALAPKPAPTANALLDTNALRQELFDLSQYPNVPQAKLRAGIIQKQLEEASKLHVVPNVGLVSGAGQTIVASGMAPTDIKRLTTERDALPAGDPRRKVYDQAIADIGGSTRVAQSRLAFDKSKFEWEKANPGFELKETEDGSIVGVNKRTLQAFPVTTGGAMATTPTGGISTTGGGIPTGRTAPAGQLTPTSAPVEGAPVVGTPLKGKATALTEAQGNATAFGMRMLEANTLLNQLEKQDVTSGGRIKGTVQGTLTSLVPYMGENLAQGAGAIMNTLPSFAGGPSEQQQMYQQAKTNFITAVLRKESGATIQPSEFKTEDEKYFPQAGDTAGVLKQKQKARELAIEAMKIQAGPGSKSIKPFNQSNAPSATPSAVPNASANNPLGLPGR
jgi:hypothetical protein